MSKDTRINDTTNIRNHDIVGGSDIKGGQNVYNGVLNTSTGIQVFKLQELLNNIPDYSQLGYTTGPVTTTHTSDISVDSHVTSQQSGSSSSNTSNDSTSTTTTTTTRDPMVSDETKKKVGGFFKNLFGLSELMYTTGPVITTHTSDVSVDTHVTNQVSGTRSGTQQNDSTSTTSTTCTPPRYVDYTHTQMTARAVDYLENVALPKIMNDPCYPAAQKAGYMDQLRIIKE